MSIAGPEYSSSFIDTLDRPVVAPCASSVSLPGAKWNVIRLLSSSVMIAACRTADRKSLTTSGILALAFFGMTSRYGGKRATSSPPAVSAPPAFNQAAVGRPRTRAQPAAGPPATNSLGKAQSFPGPLRQG